MVKENREIDTVRTRLVALPLTRDDSLTIPVDHAPWLLGHRP